MEGDLYIRSVCFSPDGLYLATGAEDMKIRVRKTFLRKNRVANVLHIGLGYPKEAYPKCFGRP